MNQKIKAVIFDLNGVFIESRPLSERIAEKFGVDKDLFYTEGKNILKIARTSGEKSSNLWEPVINLLNISKSDFFNFWFSGETINLKMFEFAKELKTKNLKIFILSNNFKERTEYYRLHFPELLNTFNGVYFSYETGFVKPDPKAWENILNTNKLSPSDCIYFDDSPDNVEAVKTLGINAEVFENLESCRRFIEEKFS